jgi:hypothetical protein
MLGCCFRRRPDDRRRPSIPRTSSTGNTRKQPAGAGVSCNLSSDQRPEVDARPMQKRSVCRKVASDWATVLAAIPRRSSAPSYPRGLALRRIGPEERYPRV